MTHVHHWRIDTPQAGNPVVAGACACGASREFAAWESLDSDVMWNGKGARTMRRAIRGEAAEAMR